MEAEAASAADAEDSEARITIITDIGDLADRFSAVGTAEATTVAEVALADFWESFCSR